MKIGIETYDFCTFSNIMPCYPSQNSMKRTLLSRKSYCKCHQNIEKYQSLEWCTLSWIHSNWHCICALCVYGKKYCISKKIRVVRCNMPIHIIICIICFWASRFQVIRLWIVASDIRRCAHCARLVLREIALRRWHSRIEFYHVLAILIEHIGW